MIASHIAMLEQADPTIMPQRNTWLCWYTLPETISNNVNALTEMEAIVKDGGELHRMVQERNAQLAGISTTTARHEPKLESGSPGMHQTRQNPVTSHQRDTSKGLVDSLEVEEE